MSCSPSFWPLDLHPSVLVKTKGNKIIETKVIECMLLLENDGGRNLPTSDNNSKSAKKVQLRPNLYLV